MEKESPTLSKVSKHAIMLIAVVKGWWLWSADVKSAFLQADDVGNHGIRLFGKPTKEMETRLVSMGVMKTGQVLQMHKPAFGDVRAPRLWNRKIDSSLKQDGWHVHKLDPCLYVSYRPWRSGDPEAEKTWFQEKWMILDGILGVHVDDFIGCGEKISERKDLDRKIAMIALRNFSERMVKLSQDFRFGSWDFVKEKGGFLFCGGEVNYDEEKNEIRMTHETYVHKVKPITIDKNRKKQEQEECTPKEVHQLRAGIGAVAWPSNQSSPHLTCSVSLMQATVAKAPVSDLCVFNKALSFAKNNADVGLRFNDICNGDVSKLRIGCYFDAAWAVRPDASSQGGYIVFAINEERIQDGKPTPLVILDWSSKKLPRKARSSLAPQVQAGSAGTDQLEWIKVFLTLIWHGEWSAVAEETARWLGKSPVITDAKSLYDAARSVTSGLGLAEKRTALEADAMLDRLKFMDAELKWTSAFQQVADGLTKPRARQCMAESLRRGTHALKYSEGCVAGKKMTSEQKKSIEDELQEKEEGAQDAKVKKKKAGRPSSWKTWGAPSVLKAITLAESFRTTEGSEVAKNFQVEVFKNNLTVDFDLRWRLMDVIVAILLILVVKKMCDWIWPVTKNSKDAEKKFVEQGTQTMNMDEERVTWLFPNVIYMTPKGEHFHTPTCHYVQNGRGKKFYACRKCIG